MRDNDFFSWRRDMLHQFQSMATGEEVYNLLQRETEALEYDYYTLCVRHPVPFTRPRVTFQSTYPRAWMSHYQAENYFAIDPVLRPENFMRGHLPWNDSLFRDAPALWDGARDHGLQKGVTQCLTLPNHAQGFLSVSANNRLPGGYPEDELELRLRTLTELSLLTLLRLEDEMVMPPEMKFSRRSALEEGTYVEHGMIYVAHNGQKRPLFSTDRILIPGQHNVENYLAAIAAVQGMVSDEVILHTAETFPGVEHRIELVRTKDGVRYYNDSIASSPTRTIAGLRSFPQKVILIAGGYDKKIPFDVLGKEVQDHVKTLVLTGHTAEKIRQAVVQAEGYQEGHPTILMEDDFKQAVLAASQTAQEGDVVILSPACASFDHFKNFAQRGQTFKDIVNAL